MAIGGRTGLSGFPRPEGAIRIVLCHEPSPSVQRRCEGPCDAGEMTPSERGETAGPAAPTAHADLTGDLEPVVGSLHETYDARVGAAVVDSEIQQVADRFVGARIRAYVPLFVRRYAGARLRADAAEPRRPRDR